MKVESALINILAVLESLSTKELEIILEKLDMSDDVYHESFQRFNEHLNQMMNESLSR